MDDGRFRVLMHVLNVMKNNRDAPLESAIIRIIESFREALTTEQLDKVHKEFSGYEARRREMEKQGKMREAINTERYRELCHRDPISEEKEWGSY